jgi:hypothetical protein
MFEGLTKKLEQKKTKKTKIFPRVPLTRHSGKRPFPECQGQGTRGRGHLPRVLGLGTRGNIYFFCFLHQLVCEAFPHYLKLLAQIWLTFEFVCYISLVFSFS